MQLRKLPIDQLRPAPYNPRVKLKPGDKGWKKLERSLDEFDLVQPIVWNERTGHVVGGHQRLEILRHRGVLAVDCVVVDLPLEREKALNVTLNNSNVGSTWDVDQLTTLLEDLSALPDFDSTLTGFNDRELRDLMYVPSPDRASEEHLPSTTDDPGQVIATLHVPVDDWESARGYLDDLLADHPDVRVQVQEPRD